MSRADQRIDRLETEVAQLRQVIEERLAAPAPMGDAELLISVTAAAELAQVTT